MYFLEFSRMSQHGYMRHTATPPLVLEIGQKLWQYCPILSTIVSNLAADYSIFLKFCIKFTHMTPEVLEVQGQRVKNQGHSVT